jgi:hypothetical protein
MLVKFNGGTIQKPYWYDSPYKIGKLFATHGIFTLRGKCQLLYFDFGTPVGVAMQRPKRITEERGVVIGTFVMNDHEAGGNRKAAPKHVLAAYNRKLQAFVHKMDGTPLQVLMANPNIRYLTQEERVLVLKGVGE